MTSEAAHSRGGLNAAAVLNASITPRATKRPTLAEYLSQPIFHLILFLTAFLLIFSRRPDAVSNAQFFAEDGQRWFADAYNLGWRSLLIPDEAGGYLHTVPRLASLLSLLFPLAHAPLVLNLFAIVVQILPVTFLASSRFSTIALRKRLVISLAYLGLPNTYGTNANVTNLQWHLGLVAFMVLIAEPARNYKWQLFDAGVLFLISIESPIGIVLAVMAAVLRWVRPAHRPAMSALYPGAVAQAIVILTSHARHLAPNGASISRLVSILGRQVFLPSIIGKDAVLHFVLRHSEHSCFLLESAATGVGIAVLLYALMYGHFELKFFILFSFFVLILCLTRPLAGVPNQAQWEWLRFPGTSNRYFFLPILAFFVSVLWSADAAKHRAVRICSVVLVLCLAVGTRRDWSYPAFTDMHFRRYARQFQLLPLGTRMVIPINPPPWTMRLIKK